MAKLCIKKIFKGLLYAILFYTVYLLLGNVLITISNFFKNTFITFMFIVGIPAFIVSMRIYRGRRDNSENKKKYMDDNKDTKMSFGNEFKYIIKLKEFQAEMISIAIIILGIISAALSSKENLSVIAVFSLYAPILAGIDFLIWYLVHRYWRKNNMHNI